MRLEVNGQLSSGKSTKHIRAKYFFIKDVIHRGDLEVQHCPTEMMWADILNKPKQGAAFRLDRSHLQNVPVAYDDEVERKSTHPSLLPTGEWKGDSSRLNDMISGRSSPTSTKHRSVLEKPHINDEIAQDWTSTMRLFKTGYCAKGNHAKEQKHIQMTELMGKLTMHP